jgi:hypothetical protein
MSGRYRTKKQARAKASELRQERFVKRPVRVVHNKAGGYDVIIPK